MKSDIKETVHYVTKHLLIITVASTVEYHNTDICQMKSFFEWPSSTKVQWTSPALMILPCAHACMWGSICFMQITNATVNKS